MRMMGFDREEKKDVPDPLILPANESAIPVPSLVGIRFDDSGRELTYFNDRFDLREGDRVFVSGKLEGKAGIVQSVTTKFKIRRSDYEQVIALAQTRISGTYTSVRDKMLSYDAGALLWDAFRAWILPPVEKIEDDVVYGGGYAVPLNDLRAAEGADPVVIGRAATCSGSVDYVGVRGGAGHAFVKGSRWYELEFTLKNGRMEEAYCSCPYPGLCKHLLAAAMVLSVLSEKDGLDLDRDFTLVGRERFFDMIRHNGQTVTV